jgi:hypothetical protein
LEIAPIASPPANQARTSQTGEDVQIPEQDIVSEQDIIPAQDSISEQDIIPGIAAAASLPPAAETVRDDPVRSGIGEPVPERTTAAQFSAPVIGALEKGMYYLQLRAFSKTDLVQAELARLGDTYPLAVQAGGTQEKPFYRVLVGPVNLGESSALLRRFKGDGYGDAFVRQAE